MKQRLNFVLIAIGLMFPAQNAKAQPRDYCSPKIVSSQADAATICPDVCQKISRGTWTGNFNPQRTGYCHPSNSGMSVCECTR